VAQYLKKPDYHTAAAIYNGTYVVLSICFNVLFRYAAHDNRLLGKDVDRDEMQVMLRQFRFGFLPYAVTFALTWVSVPISLILNLLMALFWALPVNRRPSLRRASSPFAKPITKQTETGMEAKEQ
jgi:hypothetical protein